MKYRFFTLKQAENALRLAEKNIAPRIDEVFRPTRLEQMRTRAAMPRTRH